MKSAPFDYVKVDSVQDCVAALAAADGDGKILAGGQSFAPVLAMRLARPRLVVDVNGIPGLAAISVDDGRIGLGALVRHVDLLEQPHSPLLAEVAGWIGHAAIRSRGTTGGSIAHADPSAELPVVAALLDARMSVVGPGGTRVVAAGDLFEDALQTTLEDDEMIVHVDMPNPQAWGFAELSRRHGDFGMITVITALVEDQWRVCIGGVAGVPFRALESEQILADGPLDADRIREAARSAAAAVEVSSDLHASATYRRAMAEEFTLRALRQATTPTMKGVA
ncbi:MAG: hypothetical protein JWR27_2711 [Aeromicrobium sp.]|jgi:carbon-monoxide dehydrogenase medium subunit|nr:hypothetical protein [Aeromicrobium sp.]